MIAETDVLGLLPVVITAGISLVALVLSIKNSRDKSHTESYSDLDVLYLDILKMGVENPELRDREKTTHYKESFSNEQLIKYETYAYMVWNVCETVYDRTQGNEKNMTTWKPVIIAEKNCTTHG